MRVSRFALCPITLCTVGVLLVLYINIGDILKPNMPHVRFLDTQMLLKTTKSRVWQQVGQSNDSCVFSAYYNEDTKCVQIVGLVSKPKIKSKFICSFQKGTVDVFTVQGLLEHVDRPTNYIRFHTVYILCPVPGNYTPSTIELQLENNTASLKVIYNKPNLYNFTVCLPSFFGPYSDSSRVIETVETDMVFGAEFFIVYKLSVKPEVDKVLRYYVAKGVMEVVTWDIPVNVHYHGQWALLQDCLMASKYTSKYLVVKDLDELIVPHKHETWLEFITATGKDNSNIGSYTFRNSFFVLGWKPDISNFKYGDLSKRLKIKSLLYIWRTERFFPKQDRCKSIIHPERVVVNGIHYVMKFVKGYIAQYVDPEIAFLHHYRRWRNERNRTRDDYMRKFTNKIIGRVNETLFELEKVHSNKLV